MEDVFVCAGVRTPIGRFGGELSLVRPDDLAAAVVDKTISSIGLDPGAVDEVVMGCSIQAGEDGRNVARMAVLLSEQLDAKVPALTVNRLCASGLDAVSVAARSIAVGDADLVLAGGVESMSRAPFVFAKSETAFDRGLEIFDTTIGWRFVHDKIASQYGVDSMPETAESVADAYGVARADQDAYACRSQERTAAAAESGWFEGEIEPISVKKRNSVAVVSADEHPRPGTTIDSLTGLRPIVREGGSVTAGNSSGINDGAAAIVLASRSAVEKYALEPISRLEGSASVGVEPRLMGIGPVPAVNKLLNRLGASMSDYDLVELNEAFSAQVLASARQLGLSDDSDVLNPRGGSISLGHPLGMSGARLVLTASRAIGAGLAGRALATACVGVGQGVAISLARP